MAADDVPPEGPQVDLQALIQAEVQRYLAAQATGSSPSAGAIVDDVLELHVNAKLFKQRKGSQQTVRSRFRALSRHLGAVPVMELTHDHFDGYLDKRHLDDGVSRATATMELQALITAIKTGIKRRLVPYNPLAEYEFEAQTGSRDRAYTETEIEAALDASIRCKRLQIYAVIQVMRNTGIRPKELITSAKASLNWATGSLHIPESVSKTGAERWCVIWPDGLAALRALTVEGSPWLFPSPNDPQRHISSHAICQQWRKIADVACLAPDTDGSPPELYAMRGTLATRLVMDDNMGEQQLMGAMGWTTAKQAKAYVRRGERQMLEQAARLQAAALARKAAAKRPPATVTSILSARKKTE